MMEYWGNVASGLLVFSKNSCRVLLQHRSPHVNEPNTWGIIGGAVSQKRDWGGESFSEIGVPEDAILSGAIREFREETGYRGELTDVEKYHIFKTKNGRFQYHSYFGFVDDEFEPENTWESQGYAWVDVQDLIECAKQQRGGCPIIDGGALHPYFKRALSLEEVSQVLAKRCP